MVAFYDVVVYLLAYIGLYLLAFYLISYWGSRKIKLPKERDDFFVSIIIPAYNEENSIARTIESAMGIDYPKNKLEIIIVDDGSKDKTYERALAFRKQGVRVFTKPNGGKGAALNLGISKARGELILSMDADTFAEPSSLKQMVAYFGDKNMMAVSAGPRVYRPRTIWQRIQHAEYYLGLFLRRTFSSLNALYITPGAFSLYRKVFFDKYGGYDEGNITEDLEIALRIQSHDYGIAYAPRASFFTLAPGRFKELLYQRRRWYTGLIKNLWAYRTRIFGRRRGALGTIIIPSMLIGTILSVASVIYLVTHIVQKVGKQLGALKAINFQFASAHELNSYLFSQIFYSLFSHPIFLLTLFFILVSGFYLIYARYQLKFREPLFINFALFLGIYSFLFAFWWIVSSFSLLFNRRVHWRVKHAD